MMSKTLNAIQILMISFMILVVSFQKAFCNEKKKSIDNKIVLKESELKISPLFYAGWAYGSESPIAILLGLKFNGGI